MFRTLALAVSLTLATSLVLASPAFAQEARPTIALSATGSASAVPDMAELSFSVEERAATARQALDATSAVVAKALTDLAELGIDAKDVRTQGFSVQPEVVYPNRGLSSATPEDLAPKVVGYRVTNGVAVELRDLDRLGTVLDRMVAAGMNTIGAIRFTNADVDAIREEARRDAVARALRRARTLTSAAGVKLGRILAIREGAVRLPQPRAMAARMESARAVPIARGEADYSITVQMEWAIE